MNLAGRGERDIVQPIPAVNEIKAFLLSKDNQVSVLKHLLEIYEQVIVTLKYYHYIRGTLYKAHD